MAVFVQYVRIIYGTAGKGEESKGCRVVFVYYGGQTFRVKQISVYIGVMLKDSGIVDVRMRSKRHSKNKDSV